MHGKPPFRCTRVGHGDFAEATPMLPFRPPFSLL